MALTLNDHRAILKGFQQAGYVAAELTGAPTNPLRVEWWVDGQPQRYRLWAFDITHGGGGSTVRAADEFRIQITNGPASPGAFGAGGWTDLLIGYSRDRDAIVAYDRRWLEGWSRKKEETGGGGSPSVQVKEADIQAGHDKGIHHLTKGAGFGTADIVTLSPLLLPAYLRNHEHVLRGTMTATEAQATIPPAGNLSIVDYCRAQGFPFEADLIARYLAAALTKPFVILAGISGTGKSKLAELVAEYYSADRSPPTAAAADAVVPTGDINKFIPAQGAPNQDRFALVAVRPDWIDNQSILGFVNPITTKYESTQALDLILQAQQALDSATDKAAARRYFMLLDEMNLARVEHYFSDWLACTESRRYRSDQTVQQQPVPLHRAGASLKTSVRLPNGMPQEFDVPATLPLPTNLIVTGTVNVDETTYGFSPKVLDRAMVLEFDTVDLAGLRNQGASVSLGGYRLPDALPAFRLPTSADYAALPEEAHRNVLAINGILESARLHLGYRAANEIALFMKLYNDMLPPSETDGGWRRALDVAIVQKVLPRLSGNRAKLESPLASLCAYFKDFSLPGGDAAELEFTPDPDAVLPRAYQRTLEMLTALRGFGFVSFFK